MSRIVERLKTGALTVGTSLLMIAPALAQQGPGPGPGAAPVPAPGHHPWFGGHPMMGFHHHHGHGGMMMHGLVGGLIGLLALIGFVCVVMGVIRAFRGRCGHDRRRGNRAGLEILETRYAKSEIPRDEYLEKKRDLGARA